MTKIDYQELSVSPDGKTESEQPVWRKDFPIDWPSDSYVARREFTKFLILISMAFSTGQFWILFKSFLQQQEAPFYRIASVDEVVMGKPLLFSYPTPQDKCLLIKLDSDRYVAFSQACTHLSCPVIPEPEKGRFLCPCHQGVFDIATGSPIAGPPRRPLTQINLEIRDGVIYATSLIGI